MAMQANEIENMIREQFPNASITITDLAGDGNHYSAEVIDESFKNMNRVQQQRAVYAALKGKMDGSNGELHALALCPSHRHLHRVQRCFFINWVRCAFIEAH